ncbi:tetraspanin-9-like, partial [Nothobranchius furzeri]
MARGCICCVKYMLFLFNLLFWLGGCGLLGVGLWLSVSQGSFATLSPSFPSLSAANLIITLGTVVMVTGFLGCLGAIKENKCLLLSFFIVLLIILLAELILLILFFVYTDKVGENARRDLREGLLLFNTDNNAGLRDAWNTIQRDWKCCGVVNQHDWHTALHENVLPDSCCQQVHPGCGRNASSTSWTRVSQEKSFNFINDFQICKSTLKIWNFIWLEGNKSQQHLKNVELAALHKYYLVIESWLNLGLHNISQNYRHRDNRTCDRPIAKG